MKKLLVVGLIFTLFLISYVSAQAIKEEGPKYHYEGCDEWDGWTYCEKGFFHEKLIRDGQGKGHLIFINQGTIEIRYNEELVYRGANPSTIIAHSNEVLPYSWYIVDLDTYIIRDIDYDFYGDKICTFIQFKKVTNDNMIFDNMKYVCYSVN